MSDNPLQFTTTADLRRLAAEHIAAHDGRCAGCRSTDTPQPMWPCGLRNLADAELRARRQPPGQTG